MLRKMKMNMAKRTRMATVTKDKMMKDKRRKMMMKIKRRDKEKTRKVMGLISKRSSKIWFHSCFSNGMPILSCLQILMSLLSIVRQIRKNRSFLSLSMKLLRAASRSSKKLLQRLLGAALRPSLLHTWLKKWDQKLK